MKILLSILVANVLLVLAGVFSLAAFQHELEIFLVFLPFATAIGIFVPFVIGLYK